MFQREGDGKCRAVMQLSGYIARGVLPTYAVISEGREGKGERGEGVLCESIGCRIMRRRAKWSYNSE